MTSLDPSFSAHTLAARPAAQASTWPVGALLRAMADALAARFNPVRVRGELSGWSRAASGHCYFTLKDADGQLRCALFRRNAAAVTAWPRDGDQVEVVGKLDVYGPRGDLQLIADTLVSVGQGVWFERFVQLKQQLEAEGWFAPERKRALPRHPRSIGVVTSRGAAAWHDVMTALQRRVPHVPVTLFPASVQGQQAPAELCAALERAYRQHRETGHPQVLLLVRGGGSIEDLWAFNDETLARTLGGAPMPTVCGVGHETDFTIADFVADLRAPTPTAAAELCAPDRASQWAQLERLEERLGTSVRRVLDVQAQRLDRATQRFTRPSERLAAQRQRLLANAHRLQATALKIVEQKSQYSRAVGVNFSLKMKAHLSAQQQTLDRHEAWLHSADPRQVLQRGYAWLADGQGQPITRAAQTASGQAVVATLADGEVELTVR